MTDVQKDEKVMSWLEEIINLKYDLDNWFRSKYAYAMLTEMYEQYERGVEK